MRVRVPQPLPLLFVTGNDMGRKRIKIIGIVYGRLVVLEEIKILERKSCRFYRCRCECGNMRIVAQGNLRSGNTRSCGCLRIKDDW